MMLHVFLAAALSITTLYRSSRKNSKRAYNAGYAAACQDLLNFIQQGVSASDVGPPSNDLEGGMTIGKVMDWTEARVDAIKAREEEEEEDEEREKEKEKDRPPPSAAAPSVAVNIAPKSEVKKSVVPHRPKETVSLQTLLSQPLINSLLDNIITSPEFTRWWSCRTLSFFYFFYILRNPNTHRSWCQASARSDDDARFLFCSDLYHRSHFCYLFTWCWEHERRNIYGKHRFQFWKTKNKKFSKLRSNSITESEYQCYPGFPRTNGYRRGTQRTKTCCSKMTSADSVRSAVFTFMTFMTIIVFSLC